MSIIQTKDSLADAQIAGNTVAIPNPTSPELTPKPKKFKKVGFLGSTIIELKKVQWPSLRYTTSWSAVVLVFTIVLSMVMGLFDKVFQDSVEYIQCRTTTSSETCSKQLENRFFFRK